MVPHRSAAHTWNRAPDETAPHECEYEQPKCQSQPAGWLCSRRVVFFLVINQEGFNPATLSEAISPYPGWGVHVAEVVHPLAPECSPRFTSLTLLLTANP